MSVVTQACRLSVLESVIYSPVTEELHSAGVGCRQVILAGYVHIVLIQTHNHFGVSTQHIVRTKSYSLAEG